MPNEILPGFSFKKLDCQYLPREKIVSCSLKFQNAGGSHANLASFIPYTKYYGGSLVKNIPGTITGYKRQRNRGLKFLENPEKFEEQSRHQKTN